MPKRARFPACTALRLGLLLAPLWPLPALAATGQGMSPETSAAGDKLHVASPDWRDQVIYFLMTDRFDDGDTTNNDQHAGEFAAGDTARYNGGDLRGVERRLDYIKGLGATAVWITPPVANLWWNAQARHGGYHGYWAENFKLVDAHLGTLADYQRLSRKIHGAGMYLVQDIVLNHTGSWFDYEGGWNATDPQSHFKLIPDSRGRTAPSQWPFSMNDARIAGHRAAGVYHWTPKVEDFKDPNQVVNFQMGMLDDLNSESALVREALRESHGYWIRAAGVDAFRLDTAFYVPPEALADFLYNDADGKNPGVLEQARRTGRHAFHVFGEGYSVDKAFEDGEARRIEALARQDDGSPLMPAMINFPLYATIGDVFARGRPSAELAHRIDSMMRVHAQPHLMPTFLDNHDVDRFLAGGGQAGLKQGLLLMMTLPGIPTIYYGTEQGFTVPRAAMFRQGSDSGGVDHFEPAAPLYQFIKRATALRKRYPLFSRGRPTVLKDNAAGPGVLAYRMTHGAQSAIVVFNSSDRAALLDNLGSAAPAGSVLRAVFDIDGAARDVVVDAGGQLSLELSARSGSVWLVDDNSARRPVASPTAIATKPGITIDALPADVVGGDFAVSGTASGIASVQLVVDGDLTQARPVPVDASGRWRASVDTSTMIDAQVRHQVVAWAAPEQAASPARQFRVAREWTPLVEVIDTVGDDRGPRQRYVYPADASWRAHRQLDIRQVRIAGSGGAMKITLGMHAVTTPWNPPNGFDHVAFTIFIQVPGRTGGTAVMPLQNASLPQGMQWHYRLRAHGWSNALFDATGATTENEGTAAAPAAGIEVDAANQTISFTLPASSLGHLKSLAGVKLYISTWDYDGGYRPLQASPGNGSFGGGDGARDPLVMDDTGVISLP